MKEWTEKFQKCLHRRLKLFNFEGNEAIIGTKSRLSHSVVIKASSGRLRFTIDLLCFLDETGGQRDQNSQWTHQLLIWTQKPAFGPSDISGWNFNFNAPSNKTIYFLYIVLSY